LEFPNCLAIIIINYTLDIRHLPGGSHVATATSLHLHRQRVDAAGAVGVEDPHHVLERAQLEAEDEAVVDEEVVAEGEGLLALGEDGVIADTKDNIHWPD
jgi:hypothetical protein